MIPKANGKELERESKVANESESERIRVGKGIKGGQ
ncbi:hypothetical protein AJ85_19810 [Alkalihalobacillus alcalophilus ATCC 27647 = CGMCC 1.3604]|uniref:Uncharacterized protein n=1 Tax=Alkalihalobacillus alcalophilus ATCC 27647 = CGMCC 1.3604 TaxID=1218173 RepID=A0A4S4JV63_ALKAL|nr:hypothetical protein AJ85_19810 [Alkalihalobacillus alcalophilus ATCC 27647 = CGMCC 1.3604]